MLERRCAWIRAYGGCYLIVSGDDWKNTKIINKLFGGRRQPPFDEETHNNQPKTGADNGGQ
jgi:hypothetical protein